MKKAHLLFAALLVAGCGEKSTGDPKIDQALKEAVELDSLQYRDGLNYQINESEPYSGWAKEMYDSGQVERLVKFKDGKQDGLATAWHENGQKQGELTWKDGEKVSEKFWNSKGEEVESEEEALK